MKWFTMGPLPNTTMFRYAVVDHGYIVDVTVSKPDGEEIPRPAVLKFKRSTPSVTIKKLNAQEYIFSTKANGEQARRPTWRRAGRKVAQ